ncbi:MAG: 50S ribosomal protein L23 [Pseudomonadota bacterium]
MSTKAARAFNTETADVYDVLLAPVITEKATTATENNQYTFKVVQAGTKADIKAAVEKLYSVEVESVNTMNVKGKTTRFRGRKGKRNDVKKAIIRLAQGQTIDLSAGL